MSWLRMSISNVWALPFLLEVALLGKVQAMPVPPVPKQKVCDEEKLLQVKCSQDPSFPALRMPHGSGAAVGYITGLHQHAQACNEPPALHQGCWELPNLRRVFAGCKQLTALSGVVPRGCSGHPRSSVVGRCRVSDSTLLCRQRHCAMVLGK